MSSKDAHLYGQRPASRTKTKQISSTSSVAFTSALSSLIKTASTTSSSTSSNPLPGRARPSKKEDIFTSHNKNVKKRALKDLEDSAFTEQKYRGRTVEEKQDDDANWRRTKRRMEEKARLYDALKRGDVEDREDKYGVDFDRKWADAREKDEEIAASSSESEASEEEEEVEYTDEFGRTRKGTRAQAAREERRKKGLLAAEPDRFTARPSMPSSIIYGDAVQTAAFNPDETIAEQMAALAAKRDRELTPPPDTHFDGKAEARTRGTGFMHFSKDEEERKQQMANLQKEREETEKARAKRRDQVEERRKLVEERRKMVKEKRAMKKADMFLDGLGSELFTESNEAEGEKKDEEA
jgi:hypothetical protein